MQYHSWRMLSYSYCTREKGCEATRGWTPAVTLLWVSAWLLLSPSPTVRTLGVHAAPRCLVFGWALCSLSVREMGGWGQKESVQTLRYLTLLFFSSPTEKEAAKFFSSRNGCGQVPVVFALRWMKKLLNGDCLKLSIVVLRFCMGREVNSEEWVALSVHWIFTL